MTFDFDLLLKTFTAEAAEHLATMEQGLLALEQDLANPEPLQEVFRAAHTLKGSAGSMGLDLLAAQAHEAEDLLSALHEGRRPLNREAISLLLEAVDALRELVAAPERAYSPQADGLLQYAERMRQAEGAGAPPKAASTPPRSPAGARRSLRVEVDKLDRMIDLIGELSVARGRLATLRGGDPSLQAEAQGAQERFDLLFFDLQQQVLQVRMVPVGRAFRQHLRTVRDLALDLGKEAELTFSGEEVELDTAVLEQVRDPLLHLLRNALDHGIEAPEVRRSKGKPAVGQLRLSARHDGGAVVIDLRDDGAGISRARVLARAREAGLLAEQAQPSDPELLELIFRPGFSTAEAVSAVSGRGVGMDVVKRNVEALRGAVSVQSQEGEGTHISLRLPLTLALVEGFSVGVGEETFVVPLDDIQECLELPLESRTEGADGVLELRGAPIPFVRLRSAFGLAASATAQENVLVVRFGSGLAGLVVDTLLGASQMVIKPLDGLFKQAPGISGCSLLSSGQVALIVDVPGLLRSAVGLGRRPGSPPSSVASAPRSPA